MGQVGHQSRHFCLTMLLLLLGISFHFWKSLHGSGCVELGSGVWIRVSSSPISVHRSSQSLSCHQLLYQYDGLGSCHVMEELGSAWYFRFNFGSPCIACCWVCRVEVRGLHLSQFITNFSQQKFPIFSCHHLLYQYAGSGSCRVMEDLGRVL